MGEAEMHVQENDLSVLVSQNPILTCIINSNPISYLECNPDYWPKYLDLNNGNVGYQKLAVKRTKTYASKT